jgi:hypothetical protein
MMRRKGSERSSGPFRCRAPEVATRVLDLAELRFRECETVLEQSYGTSFFFRREEAHEWLEVGRFTAELSSLSRRSTPPQCRRKLELMMRHGPLPLAAVTLLEAQVSRSPLTRECVWASSKAFTISAEMYAFRLRPVSPKSRILSRHMSTVTKEARETISAKRLWKRCDLGGPAEKETTFRTCLADHPFARLVLLHAAGDHQTAVQRTPLQRPALIRDLAAESANGKI